MFFEDVKSEPAVKAPGIEIPAELETPLGKLRTAVERLANIRGLIAEAKGARGQAERDRAATFEQMAADEAAVVLDGVTANPALRRAALKHSENLLGHDARIQGLQSRADSAKSEVDAAMRELSGSLENWIKAEVAIAQAAFWAAVAGFIGAAADPIAAGIGLGDPRLSRVPAIITLPDFEDGGRNAFQALRGWRDSPRMLATVQKFGAVKTAVASAISEARLAVTSLE